MRFEKGHKKQTRLRIIDVAARRFRKYGVASVGIAGLMEDAGLTHGGFYAHFTSKAELVREALATTPAARQVHDPDTDETLEALVRRYLRPAHRDQPETGCAIAALAAEIARHDQPTRQVLAGRIEHYVGMIAARLPETLPAPRRHEIATGMFSAMLGALQLARVVTDPAVSDAILETGIAAALSLARAE